MSNQFSAESSDPVEKVRTRLGDDATIHRSEVRARCPSHNGNSTNSLSLRRGDNGGAVLFCHGGCSQEEVVAALGLTMADLFPRENGTPFGTSLGPSKKASSKKQDTVTTDDLPDGTYWEFTTPAGKVLYIQRHRREYYKKVGEDLWEAGLEGVSRVLYNLPELVDGVRAGKTIYHLEGPKDVETAREKLGAVATTSGGVKTWNPEFKNFYLGAD